MSSHLHIIANHTIEFGKKALSKIGTNVCEILNNNLKFSNINFIENDFKLRNQSMLPQNNWSFVISQSVLYGGFNESDYLQIKSPWQIEIIVEEDHLVLFPIIHKTKHYHWFNYDPKTSGIENTEKYFAYQNEWSKVIMSLVHTLGGDTAYMLADLDYDHNYYSATSFMEIEKTIFDKCGPAKTSYKEMNYIPDDEDDIATPYLQITNESVLWDLNYK